MRLDTCPFGVITLHFGIGIITGLRAGSIRGRGFSERKPSLGPSQPAVGTGVKRSGPEADRSPPSSKGKVHPREATKTHRGVDV